MGHITKNALFFLFVAVMLTSCSNFQKLLKSDNVALKYEEAKKLFNEEEYQKAVLLLEDILPFYRATKENDKVSYMYAYCQYALGNNIIAATRFKELYDLYPYGKYAEDALFHFALCTYEESPPLELDQKSSYSAIEAIQLFINKYPKSDKLEVCNEYIDKLLDKIEEKAIRKAMLFYKIEDYKAAVWTLKQVLEDYPLTKRRSELQYTMLSAYYKLAQNSIDLKKKERYEDVIRYYEENKDEFEKGDYNSTAANLYKNSLDQVNKSRYETEN